MIGCINCVQITMIEYKPFFWIVSTIYWVWVKLWCFWLRGQSLTNAQSWNTKINSNALLWKLSTNLYSQVSVHVDVTKCEYKLTYHNSALLYLPSLQMMFWIKLQFRYFNFTIMKSVEECIHVQFLWGYKINQCTKSK